MAEPYLGQIIIAGFNFAPRGYAFCNGQILSIAQNTALFALLGTTYGGNGQTTFALPNLQSRVPNHFGQGPGLSPYSLGQQGGTENTTLTINQMPAHNHLATATGVQASSSQKGTVQEPQNGAVFARSVDNNGTVVPLIYRPAGTATDVTLGGAPTVTVGVTGGSQPFSILQPYLALNFCIALEGIFPSRN